MKGLIACGFLIGLMGILGLFVHRFPYQARPHLEGSGMIPPSETRVLSVSPRVSLAVLGVGVALIGAGMFVRRA